MSENLISAAGAAVSPFTAKLKLILIGTLIAIIAAIGLYIDYLQDELAAVQVEKGRLEIQLQQKTKALEEADARTKKLKEDADAWASKAKELQKQAEQEAKKDYEAAKRDYDEAKRVLNTQPAPDHSELEAVNELLDSLIPVVEK